MILNVALSDRNVLKTLIRFACEKPKTNTLVLIIKKLFELIDLQIYKLSKGQCEVDLYEICRQKTCYWSGAVYYSYRKFNATDVITNFLTVWEYLHYR